VFSKTATSRELRFVRIVRFRALCIDYAATLVVQSLLGYTAFDAGLSVSPRGFGAFAALFLSARLVGRVDSRLLAGLDLRRLGWPAFFYAS